MTDIPETIDSLEASLGDQIRGIRLRQNISQAALAKEADMSIGALQNLETGDGATVRTLIKVLKALDRLGWLQTLQPEVSISPMQHLVQTTTQRQRARKTR